MMGSEFDNMITDIYKHLKNKDIYKHLKNKDIYSYESYQYISKCINKYVIYSEK